MCASLYMGSRVPDGLVWSRGQTDIYGLFCEFVAPPRKKNLVTIFSQGHVLGPWKPMFY